MQLRRLKRWSLTIWLATLCSITLILATFNVSPIYAQSAGDWTTYGYNNARNNYNPNETALTTATVPNLKLKWTQFAADGVSVQPIEVNNTVYWGSWDGYEHAFTTAGVHIWDTSIGQTTDSSCDPVTVGVASSATYGSVGSTPAIFVGGGNATFYALNAATGAVLWSTNLGSSPSHFIWDSPLLSNGSVYIGTSSFGDCPLVQSQLLKLDAATGAVQATFNAVPNGCTGAGIWGSPSLGTSGTVIYIATGNPGACSSPEPYGSAVIKLQTSDLSVVGSWQVPASQLTGDGDFGSTPNIYDVGAASFAGVANKNGIYYALNRSNFAAGPVWQTKVANDATDCPQCGDGSIAPSAWDGQTLYVGGGSTTINGTSCAGSINALNPTTGAFIWQHCLSSGPVLGSVTAIPGVVIVTQGNWIIAVNSSTGTTIFRFNDAQNVFYGPVSVSNGMVFAANMDGNLYAFGL